MKYVYTHWLGSTNFPKILSPFLNLGFTTVTQRNIKTSNIGIAWCCSTRDLKIPQVYLPANRELHVNFFLGIIEIESSHAF